MSDHFRRHKPAPFPGLFLKLWFGFIAAMVVSVFVAGGFLLYSVASSGPEGIGRAIGSVIKGIDQGRQ